MSGRTWVIAVLVVAAGVLLFLWRDADRATPAAAAPAAERTDAAAPPALPTSSAGLERHELDPPSAAPEVAPVATERYHVRGRVLDIAGQPLANVPVHADADVGELGRSDGAGRFEVELVGNPTLVAHGEGFAPVRRSVVQPGNHEREHLLVAARAFDLGGIVVDPSAAPLLGATIEVELGDEILRGFPLPLDMTISAPCSAISDAQGRFALPAAPCPTGARLSARLDGYVPARTPAPEVARRDLYLVLTAEPPGAAITGFVLLPDHRPAAGAAVRYGFGSTEADARGAFSLALPAESQADMPLVAGLRGHGIAWMPRFGEIIAAAAPQPPATVTLVLGDATRDITGRVVDRAGRPQAGWMVSITEGTEVTRGMTPPVLVEGFGEERRQRQTEADGVFRIANLLDRPYVVRAFHRKTLLAIFSAPIRAGTEGVELVVTDNLTYERLRGRVLSRLRVPLAGVQVVPGLVTHATEWGSAWLGGTPTTTDQHGMFEFADFPKAHVHLDVDGETVVPERFTIKRGDDVENLVLTVARRCHLQVEVTATNLEDLRFEVHDTNGGRLDVYSFQASSWSSSTTKRLDAGRSGVCAASEDAIEVLVFRSGSTAATDQLVARQPMTLSPETVTEVRITLR